MEEKWILRKRPFSGIAAALPVSQVLAKIISNRVPAQEAEAYFYREGPLEDPFLMQDMEKAVALLDVHLNKGHAIQIIGDYDVDGITSGSILYLALKGLGANVRIRIPDRQQDGYGIREYMVEEAVKDGMQLIITCDNGIREFGSMEKARELGIDIILTDHHEITKDEKGQDLLPAASCILNPHRTDCSYPFKGLCGAGVAYKFMEAVYRNRGQNLPESLIGYAALGTVCDVMKLQGENRRIVYKGLAEWNRKPPVGIQALMDAGGISRLEVYHFGFVIGPMLNSGGRLENQDRYIQILLTEDAMEAAQLAYELRRLNTERQDMTNAGLEKAIRILEESDEKQMVKVIHLPEVHESIAGLIAGKIKERYQRPVFVLTGHDDHVKGSGRSVPGYDMFAQMQKQDGLFIKYGGHPMAAGLSMEEKNIDALREALNAQCTLKEEDCIPEVIIDAALPIPGATILLAEELEKLEPYGNGNEKPLFAEKGLDLRSIRIMGKNRNVARLTFCDRGEICEAITFRIEKLEEVITERYGAGMWKRLQDGEEFYNRITVDICYNLGINEYRGIRQAQCTVCNLR